MTESKKELLIIQEHWQFLEKWIRMAFYDGWKHGAKHERDKVGA